MAARKRVPAEDKISEHLTVNLTPSEMAALKELAKNDGRSVNSFVKTILAKAIRRHAETSKPFVVSFSWTYKPVSEPKRVRAATLDEVRAIAREAIAKGAGKVVVRRGAGYGGEEVDTWYPDRGWIDGEVEPKESK